MRLHQITTLFPRMPKAQFDALVEDIRRQGVLQPILVHNGEILDGRNRWEAAKVVGVRCPTKKWDGKGSITDLVISLNLQRRHLTKTQAGTVGADALPFYEAEAKKRQQASGAKHGRGQKVSPKKGEPIDNAGKAAEHAGKAVGVSRSYVEDAKAIKQKNPDAFKKLKDGTATIAQVKKEMKAKKNADRYRDLKKLALSGHTSRQIAAVIGVTPETLRKVAKKRGVVIQADVVMGKKPARDIDEVFRNFVGGLQATADVCESISVSKVGVRTCRQSLPVIIESLKELAKFQRQVKGRMNNQ